jgi:hypothetical protein
MLMDFNVIFLLPRKNWAVIPFLSPLPALDKFMCSFVFSLLQARWSTCTDCAQVPFCFSLEENVCCCTYSGEVLCFH